MTRLRVVDDTFAGNGQHSLRAVDLTAEQIADMHLIVTNVLGPAQTACRELGAAVKTSDRHAAIAALRRLLAVSHFAREYANTLERDPEWQKPS